MMPNSSSSFKIFTHFVCVAGLFVILLIEYAVIQSNRGQAMAISMLPHFILAAILLIFFLYFIDRKHSNQFSRIVAVISQCGFSLYFIYMLVFYYRVENDVQFYKNNFEDHFRPHNEDLWFAFILNVSILLYSLGKINARRIG